MEKYLEYIQKEKHFDFIKDEKIKYSLELFESYVFSVYESLQDCNDKFLYDFKKHTIMIYIGSVVEAMVYYFAKEKLSNKEKYRRKYLEIEEFRKLQDIKKTENLYICELVKKEISLNDSINFKALIDWLKDKKLMTQEIIDKIDNFRKTRNSVHINVYKNWEEIFESLIEFFNDFKDIKKFIREGLEKN